jgi:excisionase family DNA binding protein
MTTTITPATRKATRRRKRVAAVATEPEAGPLALTVNETAWLLHCNPNHVWNLIHKGGLRSFKMGRKRLVARSVVEEFVMRNEPDS